MQELEIGGRKFRTGTLNTFKQFHIFRKLLPLFSGMGETVNNMQDQQVGSDEWWKALAPVAHAVAEMSNEESEWIVRTCLLTVTTFNGRSWVPIAAEGVEDLLFPLELQGMMGLAFAVIQDNLASFFPGPLPNGSDTEVPLSLSATSQ